LVVDSPQDVIIVASDEGLLLDETNLPNGHINTFKGTALLIPGKKTVLRNVGDKGLLLVEIVIANIS
jgi:hypothetical protein